MEVLPLIAADVAIADPMYGIGSKAASSLRKRRSSRTDYGAMEDTPEYVKSHMVPSVKMAIKSFGRVAITPGMRCMLMYPKPTHIGSFQYPGSTTMSCWGPMLWQPILYYGKDPHQGRLVPDSFTGCNDHSEEVGHPCPKPVKQWTRLVERASKIGETVCDFAMGSGTTGVCCQLTGRRFIGIEINPDYFAIAVKRITEAVNRGALFTGEVEPVVEEVSLFTSRDGKEER